MPKKDFCDPISVNTSNQDVSPIGPTAEIILSEGHTSGSGRRLDGTASDPSSSVRSPGKWMIWESSRDICGSSPSDAWPRTTELLEFSGNSKSFSIEGCQRIPHATVDDVRSDYFDDNISREGWYHSLASHD
mmetsp:Transcript_17900/g.41272  ORF Transcript_17900/g.41272 Transcript_17900/m.41272 type:complete len:132 (-) Transcript_17900:721-1116(-)